MAAVTRVTTLTMEDGVGRRRRRVALVTHHTGLLDTGSVLAQLQEENMDVQVKIYIYVDFITERESGAKQKVVQAFTIEVLVVSVYG